MDNKKIIFYYQTFNSLQPILYNNTPVTHIHLSSIHFGLDENNQPYIHLNNYSPYNKKFDTMWEEIEQAQKIGIKIVLMVGGAGSAYEALFSNFNIFYNQLYNLIKNKPFITGIDLDIEETVSLDNIKMLISQIKKDFPSNNFSISTAPIQSSIQNDTPGMGGFIYKDLITCEVGKYINYINGQFYSDYSLDSYDQVIKNGYESNKIIMGMLSGQDFEEELVKVVNKYGDQFGGVFVWEYFNSNPTKWVNSIKKIFYRDINANKCDENIYMNNCNII
tara:strand:- start:3071 stop:3901 length:831 start_codon:yes stop_codon:yes gene_type:complete